MTTSASNASGHTYVLGAFDGTGSRDWRSPDGSNSHVHKFFTRFRSPPDGKRYYDGPDTLGTSTKLIAERGIADLLAILSKVGARSGQFAPPSAKGGYQCLPESSLGGIRVCLVGHSRGGHIAVWIANELSRYGVPVHFMALFDAVDRTLGFDPFHPPEGSAFALGIPSDSLSNVAFTYHALRDPRMKSRAAFGNTGRKLLDPSQVYQERVFRTSHGGIGGDPAPQKRVAYGKYGRRIEHYGVFDDRTCTPEQGAERVRLCNEQSAAADRWIIDRARDRGLPVG